MQFNKYIYALRINYFPCFPLMISLISHYRLWKMFTRNQELVCSHIKKLVMSSEYMIVLHSGLNLQERSNEFIVVWDFRSVLPLTQLRCSSIVNTHLGWFIKTFSFMIFATDFVEVWFDYHIKNLRQAHFGTAEVDDNPIWTSLIVGLTSNY